MARIDTPLLHKFHIIFFHQLIFDTPQLTLFINRTTKVKAHDEARVAFSDRDVSVTLRTIDGPGEVQLKILCELLDLQLPSLVQVCSLSFPQSPTMGVAGWEWAFVGVVGRGRRRDG